MVRRGAMVVIVLRRTHAGSACEDLLHLGLRTRAPSKISVSTNGRELSRASGEVVVGDTGDDSVRKVVCAVRCWADAASGHVLWAIGVERGRARNVAVVTDDALFRADGGLPVDRLHAALKLRRRPELPFPDNGPDESDAGDACSNNDENGDGSAPARTARGLSGGRSGRNCSGAGD